MKILIVEDDLALSDVIGYTLRRAGFDVCAVDDGRAAYDFWQAETPALLIVDISLPGIDGLTLYKRIRAGGNTPVILLSGRNTDEDIAGGLDLGADDYITKPFSPIQLVARVRAVLRRSHMTSAPRILTHRDLIVDIERREVHKTGLPGQIPLTQLECRLLEVLILNAGQVLPAESLVTMIWGVNGGDRVMLRQIVHRLRQKIDPDPASPTYIENVPGIGYAFIQ